MKLVLSGTETVLPYLLSLKIKSGQLVGMDLCGGMRHLLITQGKQQAITKD